MSFHTDTQEDGHHGLTSQEDTASQHVMWGTRTTRHTHKDRRLHRDTEKTRAFHTVQEGARGYTALTNTQTSGTQERVTANKQRENKLVVAATGLQTNLMQQCRWWWNNRRQTKTTLSKQTKNNRKQTKNNRTNMMFNRTNRKQQKTRRTGEQTWA